MAADQWCRVLLCAQILERALAAVQEESRRQQRQKQVRHVQGALWCSKPQQPRQ